MLPVICLPCSPRAVEFGVRSVRLACHCDNNVVPLKYRWLIVAFLVGHLSLSAMNKALKCCVGWTLEPDVMYAVVQEYQRCSTYVMAQEPAPRRERLRRMPSLAPMRSTTREVATQTDATPINFEASAAQAAAAPQDCHLQACVTCMDAHPDTASVPCRHLQACFACAASVHDCPICRKKIHIRLQFFQD